MTLLPGNLVPPGEPEGRNRIHASPYDCRPRPRSSQRRKYNEASNAYHGTDGHRCFCIRFRRSGCIVAHRRYCRWQGATAGGLGGKPNKAGCRPRRRRRREGRDGQQEPRAAFDRRSTRTIICNPIVLCSSETTRANTQRYRSLKADSGAVVYYSTYSMSALLQRSALITDYCTVIY